MHHLLLLSAAVGVTYAAPRPAPQNIALNLVSSLAKPTVVGPSATATSQVVPYSSSAIISSILAGVTAIPTTTAAPSKVKRDICALQSLGAGPLPVPDTASAFLKLAQFALAATSAAAAPPSTYTSVFSNLQASTQQNGYMALYTLSKYDPSLCAAKCDATAMCESFNIFYERDPVLYPDNILCANGASTTNIKCTLFGYPIVNTTATYAGSSIGVANLLGATFQQVIAGSNGYNKLWTPPTYTNFTAPTSFGNAAINAPLDLTPGLAYPNTFAGSKVFDTGRYDPSLCAVACQAQTLYNKLHPASGSTTYPACNFVNSYILLMNGIPQGTFCSMYTRPWNSSYATNTGQYRGTDVYTITESFGFSLSPLDPMTL